ncbi:hypothetical protein P2P98_04375 [Microbacterium sp. Kw_RZR3]|uniref:hypothetical protein n=1 Tax=Microbacterium sp. Kw_RZR3 TaxID=3032903 RepID=UPI0023D9CB56|nr:hypothetical protein [Microbacterium sp. Kw_RZR3]MDF2045384.1 hypothetical protein [Microbacterium sp. Kw_RZR3]
MSKPKWSANGFARLVQISGDGFWVVVEGRDHDRAHYERLLENLPSTKDRNVVIRLAEHIEVNGKAAGGKAHALALHDHLQASNDLTQSSKSGKARVVFMVDRDRDDYLGNMNSSPNVMYTHSTDVEADILLNVEIWPAVRAAYGIDSSLSGKIRKVVPDPAIGLAKLWEDWLRLGLTALVCDAGNCAPWAQPSMVNVPTFEAVDAAQVARVESAIQTVAPRKYAAGVAQASSHVARHQERLLKGRWLSRYIHALVKHHLKDEVVRVNVQADAVIDTALMGLQYTGSWAQHYESRFASLVASN